MDPGASIYSKLLNSVIPNLTKLNPQLAVQVLNEKVKVLESANIEYRIDKGKLYILEATKEDRPVLYEMVLEVLSVFERKYGINDTWNPMKAVTARFFQKVKDEVRDIGLEVPIAKYEMEFMMLETLFGFQGKDFRKKKWFRGSVLVTNQSLIFLEPDNWKIIPLQAVATVGREIYIGYDQEATKGVIRAIDYMPKSSIKTSSLSCAVVLARGDLMKEFMRVTSVMRNELRRLDPVEGRVLVALYGETPVNQLAGRCRITEEEAKKCFNRLVNLRYTDHRGHLTSYGINAAMEILQRVNEKFS